MSDWVLDSFCAVNYCVMKTEKSEFVCFYRRVLFGGPLTSKDFSIVSFNLCKVCRTRSHSKSKYTRCSFRSELGVGRNDVVLGLLIVGPKGSAL